jgi:hypothetical protein
MCRVRIVIDRTGSHVTCEAETVGTRKKEVADCCLRVRGGSHVRVLVVYNRIGSNTRQGPEGASSAGCQVEWDPMQISTM